MSKHIYELRMKDGDSWIPFYVGQSADIRRRQREHTNAAKRGEDLLVYQCIRQLTDANIEWDLFSVCEYQEEDLGTYENDRIIELLRDGFVLMNMKKGSANWLATRQAIADDMNRRQLPKNTTEKQYRAILTAEALAEKHRHWLVEEERKKQAEIDKQLRLQRQEEARIEAERSRKEKESLDRIKAQNLAEESRRENERWNALSQSEKHRELDYREAITYVTSYSERTALKLLHLSRLLHYIVPLNMETVDFHIEVAQSVKVTDTPISILRWASYDRQ